MLFFWSFDIKKLILLTLILSCSKDKDRLDPIPAVRLPELKEAFDTKQVKALEIRDSATGWLTFSDCDAMIWAGKYACSLGEASTVNLRASEYPEQPGRFDRRPAPFCWTKELGDQGSKTTWSRDMGIAGLIPGAFCSKNLKILEDHAAFGESKQWDMGEPVADGRGVYSPGVIGILYSAIKYLGGQDNPKKNLPSLYFPGLDDYQAHLQMMDIWIKGEMKESISAGMRDRIKEHYKREPECPLYSYLDGIYSGSQEKTVELLLGSNEPKCSYLRGSEKEKIDLSEWLFVANLTIIQLEK